jgi:alanine racemase
MMNHVVLDVTRAAKDDGPVTATLIGRDRAEQLSADQLASWAQTISYEIVTRLGEHLRRAVV